MDIWKPNAFHANETLFLQKDLQTVECILVFLMPDVVLSFWRVPIVRHLAKQSIELSNDISVIPCNILDILPVNVYTSTFLF